MQDTSIAPIFKGTTRPACIMGVPIKPFMGVVGGLMILALWTWLPLMLLTVVAILVMRWMTKDDDQKFHQLFLHLRHRRFNCPNLEFWGVVMTIRACNYKGGLQ